MPFRHPVNFVCPAEAIWPELRNWAGKPIDPLILSKRSGGILHSWILRSYYQLRLAGKRVELSTQPHPEALNFVSVRDFGRRQRRLDCFFVIPQGDAHPAKLGDFRIFQNGLNPPTPDTLNIWHWPQPGIVPRNADRGRRIERLSYKGRLLNLDADFRSDSFLTALKKAGIQFEIDAYQGLRGEHSWNDYSHADAVLAVRNLTVYDARKKPASKLVNAWFADVPALLGPEPAYRELWQSELDYIEIRRPSGALEALHQLRSDPALFTAMVENGRKRREAFSESAITRMWIEAIAGPVSDAFERWQSTPRTIRVAKALAGMFRENNAKKKDLLAIRSGPRLLD